MKRVAAILVGLAMPAHADIAPKMTKLDCVLSYRAAIGLIGVPTTYEAAPVADGAGCVGGRDRGNGRLKESTWPKKP
ncbi:hypothetical protein [Yoonia sp. 2307UL14-13]|uniref:hypothetical protein n=1 Tax=Yoonia sp. 2307UL14-13 TaxID=3126506 RepID=UPI00309B1D71